MDKKDKNIASQVDGRLDEIFGMDSSDDFFADEKIYEPENTPISELKEVVWSIDWEISDSIMQKFVEEINKARKAYKDDRIALMFLQLLGSVGGYIKKNRSGSHPDSINLLQSLFNNIEKVMLSTDMAEPQKKKILLGDVNKFKKLKEQVIETREKKKSKSTRKIKVEPIAEEIKLVKPKDDLEIILADETADAQIRITERQASIGDTVELDSKQASPVDPEQIKLLIAEFKSLKNTVKKEFTALRKEIEILRESGLDSFKPVSSVVDLNEIEE